MPELDGIGSVGKKCKMIKRSSLQNCDSKLSLKVTSPRWVFQLIFLVKNRKTSKNTGAREKKTLFGINKVYQIIII